MWCEIIDLTAYEIIGCYTARHTKLNMWEFNRWELYGQDNGVYYMRWIINYGYWNQIDECTINIEQQVVNMEVKLIENINELKKM